MRNAVKLLRRADTLVAEGWTQGTLARDRDGYTFSDEFKPCAWCTIGALYEAGARLFTDHDTYRRALGEAFDAVVSAIREHWPGDIVNIAHWNDAAERTARDVRRMLACAIDLAKARAT